MFQNSSKALHRFVHLILTITLQGSYWYPHFMYGECYTEGSSSMGWEEAELGVAS